MSVSWPRARRRLPAGPGGVAEAGEEAVDRLLRLPGCGSAIVAARAGAEGSAAAARPAAVARLGWQGAAGGRAVAVRAAAGQESAVAQAEERHRQRPGGRHPAGVFGQARGAEPGRRLRCPGQDQGPRRRRPGGEHGGDRRRCQAGGRADGVQLRGGRAGGCGFVVLLAWDAEGFGEVARAQGQAGRVGVQPQVERLAVQRDEPEREPGRHAAPSRPASCGRRGGPAWMAAWTWLRASSAAWSIRTSSSRPAVSDSAPVLIAR